MVFYLRIHLPAHSVYHSLSSGVVKEGHTCYQKREKVPCHFLQFQDLCSLLYPTGKHLMLNASRERRLLNELFGPRAPSSSCILWLLLGTSLSYSFSWTCFDFLLFYSSLDQILSLFFYILGFPKNAWKVAQRLSYFPVLLNSYSKTYVFWDLGWKKR